MNAAEENEFNIREREDGYGNRRDTVTWELVEPLAVLRVNPSGWSKEVNLVSWNGNKPKIDIRDWSADHEKLSKGVTLSEAEAGKLAEVLIAKGFGKKR